MNNQFNGRNGNTSSTVRALALCTSLAAGLLSLGCNQERSQGNPGNLSAVYSLQEVEGRKLPCTLAHSGTAMEVRSGTFTFKNDGTCSSDTAFAPKDKPEIERHVTATYTVDGSKIHMRWNGAGKTEGTIEGETFTMINEGMAFVYKKVGGN